MFRSYAAHDKSSRLKKAEKIIKILSKYKDLEKSKILDVGCGSGYLGSVLHKKSKKYVGIDFADERKVKDFVFIRTDAINIPFRNNSFDIVICNHVIEHVRDQKKLLHEINRLLKKDGICYITCPNKLWPIEPHLKLPFLSYLPKKIADAYVIITGKGKEYDIYPMTYSEFLGKLKIFFNLENFSLEILKNPKHYGFDEKIYSVFALFRYFPGFLSDMINNFLPTWVIILRKNSLK
ncbi:MAG: class I SAM-dependent methyltransferase [Nanoarchaeota archaeon]|nr:class I SAM-dependent methyltransferase [Nanoarchaeota archaeon]